MSPEYVTVTCACGRKYDEWVEWPDNGCDCGWTHNIELEERQYHPCGTPTEAEL